MIKILHVTYGFDGGGVGYVIRNYCAQEKMEGIRFDIVGEDTGHRHLLQDEFEKAGFDCFYVTPKKKSLIRNIAQIYRIMKKGGYDAVHVHFEEWSFLYLLAAKICGIRVRICHAHMAHVPGAEEKLHYRLFRRMNVMLATHRLACSADAGDSLYCGRPYTVLRNAVDAERFRYSEKTGKEVKRHLGIEGRFVCGTVGRLSYQKDPEYTLDIFREIKKRDISSVLVFAGKGDLEEEIREKAKNLGMEKDVLFLGHRDDIPDLMQAFDVFILPSRFEGLGIVYVEAQAAGLPSFAAKGNVPAEADIGCGLMHFFKKEEGPHVWADKILLAEKTRKDTSRDVRERGYDIRYERKRLEQIYRLSCAEGRRKKDRRPRNAFSH